MLRLGLVFEKDGSTTLFLMIRVFKPYPERFYRKGVRIAFTPAVRDHARAANTQIKSNQYTRSVQAWTESLPGDCFEALSLNVNGTVAEGTISNLMIVKQGKVFTPPASCGILKGVTRHLLLDTARRAGIPCEERAITRHDMYTADEVFLTRSSSGIMPVTVCDGRIIGNGRPGPLTKELSREFIKRIQNETEDTLI